MLCNIQLNSNRIWKDNIICDLCWFNHKYDIDKIWELISEKGPTMCTICNTKRVCKTQRFHYDHKNMFLKSDNISVMINSGKDINDIYTEIEKCNLLCISCHHMVSDIEKKLGFVNIKSQMTRKYKNGELNDKELEFEKNKYTYIYEKLMSNVLKNIKK